MTDIVGRITSLFSKDIMADQVFGISTNILQYSYVDRGHLDSRLEKLLSRNMHIALRGESKCGKSWLRKKNINDSIIVQCRRSKRLVDIYSDILSQLDLLVHIETTDGKNRSYRVEGGGDLGAGILSSIRGRIDMTKGNETTHKFLRVGGDIHDLRFIADVVKASGKKLVIEDFHYLTADERRNFAYDLKTLWDYEVFCVIIRIWTENNLLIHLNPDLSGRIEEISIYWSEGDLRKVIEQGCSALNVSISEEISSVIVKDSFNTVGILQQLMIRLLDHSGVERKNSTISYIYNKEDYESVAMNYAEQLNALYQTFSKNVADGIRKRKNATGIYAHMLAVILETDVDKLIKGLTTDELFETTHAREPRITKGNLRQALRRINSIQLDESEKGVIVSYDEFKDEICVIDRQLFFYRKYATARWPFQSIIEQVNETKSGYESDAL
jgi:hypothetical protein